MPTKINTYRCDFCNRENQDIKLIDDHEESCCFNPNNRRCMTCKHYDGGYPFPNSSCLIGGPFYEIDNGDTECPIWESKK